MGVLRVLGPDQSTVLFDFDDSTGAANPSTVVTNLGATLNLGSVDPALALELRTHGAAILGSPTLPTVEMEIPFMASAASDTALFEGLGQLYRYLLSASRDHPIYLDWTELSATRYIDVVGITEMPQLIRGQAQAGIVAGRKSSLGPLTLKLLRQPWMRLTTVTTSGVTVPNDPATGTKVRVYPVTVTGDLPTPGRIRVQMDSGATTERILVGHRAQKSRASTFFSDYLSETGFSQAEASARGWTVTRASDTTTGVNATASPGSGTSQASTAFTTNPTIMQEKISFTRTTLMDSLRGTWDVVVRVGESSLTGPCEIQAAWAPNAAGEPTETFDPQELDFSLSGGPAWLERTVGRITIPDTVSLGGMQLRLYARRLSGTGSLLWDFIWLVPSDHATIVVPGGSRQTWRGDDLVTPSGITADPTWNAGAVVGTALRLNTDEEAAGTPPAAGFDPVDGRHRVGFYLNLNAFIGTVTARITNETDNTEVDESAFSSVGSGLRFKPMEYDAAAAKSYLYSVQITSYTSGSVDVVKITDDFLPYLTTSESARTEPGPRRYGVDRLDSSGNLAGYLGCEGEVPVLLEPGNNHLFFRYEDIRAAGLEENVTLLPRTPTVTVAYDPRMAL